MKHALKCAVLGCEKPVMGRGWCSAHYARWRHHGDPLAGKRQAGTALKFLELALLTAADDCIPWPFKRNNAGYGQVWLGGRDQIVSRVVCERAHGAPPSPKHDAEHLCGNGHLGCINYRHVQWATRKENSMRRVEHGTANRGSKHGFARLTESDIPGIRRCLAAREPQSSIASSFNVGQTTISNVNTGKTWGWLK